MIVAQFPTIKNITSIFPSHSFYMDSMLLSFFGFQYSYIVNCVLYIHPAAHTLQPDHIHTHIKVSLLVSSVYMLHTHLSPISTWSVSMTLNTCPIIPPWLTILLQVICFLLYLIKVSTGTMIFISFFWVIQLIEMQFCIIHGRHYLSSSLEHLWPTASKIHASLICFSL